MGRITRKKLKEDEFVSTVDELIRRARDYWKPAAAALGAVLAGIFLWWVANQWSASRTEEASNQLQKAVEIYTQATTAGSGGDLSDAEAAFEGVIEDFGSTAQGDVARLYQARIALSQGETDSARSMLVKLRDRHKGNALGRLAALDLVKLRASSGQGAEVAKELEAMVVGRDDQLPRDVALFELGEVFRSERKIDQAREYYQKLVDEFPESPYLSQARQRLEELG